jgi:hypothetical protein
MAKGIKTGGRAQGSSNLLTAELRETLKNILSKELELIPATLESMTPDKRLDVALKLLPYILPKVESVPMGKGEPIKYDWDVQ